MHERNHVDRSEGSTGIQVDAVEKGFKQMYRIVSHIYSIEPRVWSCRVWNVVVMAERVSSIVVKAGSRILGHEQSPENPTSEESDEASTGRHFRNALQDWRYTGVVPISGISIFDRMADC